MVPPALARRPDRIVDGSLAAVVEGDGHDGPRGAAGTSLNGGARHALGDVTGGASREVAGADPDDLTRPDPDTGDGHGWRHRRGNAEDNRHRDRFRRGAHGNDAPGYGAGTINLVAGIGLESFGHRDEEAR